MQYALEEKTLTFYPEGGVDAANAAVFEEEVNHTLSLYPDVKLIMDLRGLRYVSSAGLRVFLRLHRANGSLQLINVSPELWGVFEMTGFTEILNIRKAFRELSIEGCEVIGEGAKGKLYRISPDTAVKVFTDPDSLDEIDRERQLARTAFVNGIPTAISYDVVRIREGGYGAVLELLEAESLARRIAEGKESVEEAARRSAALLKKVHETVLPPGTLPQAKDRYRRYLSDLKGFLPEQDEEALRARLEAVPDAPCLLHGDCHFHNIMDQNGELLLIDMDTLSQGDPVFELAAMYTAYCGFAEFDKRSSERYLGTSNEQSVAFWKASLACLLEGSGRAACLRTERDAKLFSSMRVLSHYLRKGSPEQKENCVRFAGRLRELLQNGDGSEAL